MRPTRAPLRGLEGLLDKPLLRSLVVTQDRDARVLEEGVLAVPAGWLLGVVGE